MTRAGVLSAGPPPPFEPPAASPTVTVNTSVSSDGEPLVMVSMHWVEVMPSNHSCWLPEVVLMSKMYFGANPSVSVRTLDENDALVVVDTSVATVAGIIHPVTRWTWSESVWLMFAVGVVI